MNKKQYTLTVTLALIGGLVGGMVASQFFMGRPAFAEKKPDGQEIKESEVLHGRELKKELGVQKVVRAESFELYDSRGFKVADLIQGSGFVRFTMWQREGGTLSFVVNGNESEIASKNPKTDNVFLIQNGNSGLAMDMACPGAKSLWFSFNKNQPFIHLHDKNGRLRAALGAVPLQNPKTGNTETREPSSLVLFDEKGNAVWSAP